MKNGYKETRRLFTHNLRRLCINENWYTKGSIEEYDNLFAMVNNYKNVDCDALAEIATNINEHSVIDGDMRIEDIMFAIAEVCISFFEEVKNE